MQRHLLCACCVFLLVTSACQPIRRPPAATPARAISPNPNLIDIGGRSLFLLCEGKGSPTVLLEAGLGGDHTSWHFVQPAVARFTRVCSYDRAGLGLSNPAPTPRTSQDVANDLQRLLTQAGEGAPLVLVGHSFGALHARLFAHEHPDKVAGLVLVDPVHEDWWSRAAALLPAPLAQENERLRSFRRFLTEEATDPVKTAEGIDIPASAAQVRASGSLGDLPLIVVKAGVQDVLAPGLPLEVETRLTELLQKELPAHLLTLSSLSIQLDVPDSGHDIPHMQPDAVVVAIRTMIDAGRLR
jgi:pimeloyl-ACP methyl ester carboxylesterase